MNDFIIGNDKQSLNKYRRYHKFLKIPTLYSILALELKYLPQLLLWSGLTDSDYLNVQKVGMVLISMIPLIFYLAFRYYSVPWGVLSVGEDYLSYKTRSMGLIDISAKEFIEYELVDGVRYDDKRSVLTIKLEYKHLEFVVDKDVAREIREKIIEKSNGKLY